MPSPCSTEQGFTFNPPAPSSPTVAAHADPLSRGQSRRCCPKPSAPIITLARTGLQNNKKKKKKSRTEKERLLPCRDRPCRRSQTTPCPEYPSHAAVKPSRCTLSLPSSRRRAQPVLAVDPTAKPAFLPAAHQARRRSIFPKAQPATIAAANKERKQNRNKEKNESIREEE